MIVPHGSSGPNDRRCEEQRDEATQLPAPQRNGLLRSARNDGNDDRHCEEPKATKQSSPRAASGRLTDVLDLFAQLPPEIEQRDQPPIWERPGMENWFSDE